MKFKNTGGYEFSLRVVAFGVGRLRSRVRTPGRAFVGGGDIGLVECGGLGIGGLAIGLS